MNEWIEHPWEALGSVNLSLLPSTNTVLSSQGVYVCKPLCKMGGVLSDLYHCTFVPLRTGTSYNQRHFCVVFFKVIVFCRNHK